jgi:thioredoxin-related protein
MRAEPIVNGLRSEWGDEVQVVQIDLHRKENQSLIAQIGFRFTPTFVLYDESGQEIWRASGGLDAAEVRRQLALTG